MPREISDIAFDQPPVAQHFGQAFKKPFFRTRPETSNPGHDFASLLDSEDVGHTYRFIVSSSASIAFWYTPAGGKSAGAVKANAT